MLVAEIRVTNYERHEVPIPAGFARGSERDSSGTTEAHEGDAHLWCAPEMREGDGADSPTRGSEAAEAARPNCFY